ncbi:hypothetical protein D3C86_1787100 [compost metagenome]
MYINGSICHKGIETAHGLQQIFPTIHTAWIVDKALHDFKFRIGRLHDLAINAHRPRILIQCYLLMLVHDCCMNRRRW